MKKLVWIIIIAVVVLLLFYIIWALVFGVFSRGQVGKNTIDGSPRTADDYVSAPQEEAPSATDPSEQVMSLNDLSHQIDREYLSDENFQVCTDRSVRSCLSEAINQKIAATGDITYCDDFFTEEAQQTCRSAQSNQLARVNQDVDYCDNLSGSLKDNCVVEATIAQAISDLSLEGCDVLPEEGKVLCVESAASRLANDTRDPVWCDQLNETLKEFCLSEITVRNQEEIQDQLVEDNLKIQKQEAIDAIERSTLTSEQSAKDDSL